MPGGTSEKGKGRRHAGKRRGGEYADEKRRRGTIRSPAAVLFQVDDVGAVDGFQLGEDGRTGHDVGPGRLGQRFQCLKGFAGGDHVVDEGHAFALELFSFTAVQPEVLFLLGGDGTDGVGNGVLHVGLAAFSGDDEVLHAHQAAEFVGEADAFGFCGHEYVHFGEALQKLWGHGSDQFGVREHHKAGQRQIFTHLHIRQFPFQPHDFKIKKFHLSSERVRVRARWFQKSGVRRSNL